MNSDNAFKRMARICMPGIAATAATFPICAFAQSAEGNSEQIALTANLQHMGNAARTSEASAQTRGLALSDEKLTVGVEVQFGRNLGRNTLNISANAGYDFYRENTRLNRERIGAEVAAGINVGPCLLDLNARIDRRQSDLETLALVNLPGEDSLRNAETTQTYRAEARCGYVYGLRPLAGFERSIGDNSTDLREISNYRSNSYYAGVGYDHPVVGKLSLRLERRDVSYPDRAGTPIATLSGYQVDEVRLSAQRDIGAFLQAEVSGGYSSVRPNDPVTPRFKGISWKVSGTARIGSRLLLNAFTEKSVSPSMGTAAQYSRSQTHQVRATFALSTPVSLSAGVSFSKRDYRGASSAFGPVLDNDRFRRVFGSVSYRASERLSLSLDAGNEKRNASGNIYDYSSNYIGLRTRLTL